MSNKLVFTDRILDNVHGFIYYTAAEKKIIESSLFKRLQSIKQLSIVNWVFPGSEHTRYIHSLGVMYIADKIATQLKLPDKDRKIIRMAGLLHDIGHYPLSHVCEYPYKTSLDFFYDDNFIKERNEAVMRNINSLLDNKPSEYMKKSDGFHHERIGASIVLNNKEIKKVIVDECGKNAPDIIADMITGNIERDNTDPLFVQILHSELDADGIDYLMRDAMFSGTSFGSFELDQLIGCMDIGEKNGKRILCIKPKGIAAADQYLINKFFSYSQVVYNKHISITEFMAQQIVDWMQKNNAFFPTNETLYKWVASKSTEEKYVRFTDNFFWASLQNILTDPLKDTEPKIIKCFCERLLGHMELEYKVNSEVKIISSDLNEIQEFIKKSQTFKNLNNSNSEISILSLHRMSKQIPLKEYEKQVINKDDKTKTFPDDASLDEDIIEQLHSRRLMECICIKEEDGSINLLCDDRRSLMHTLYGMTLAILRTYKINI